MYVDLHIHTNSSDGTWDVDELLTNVRDNDINLFSITDHDTIENSTLMARRLDGSDVRFVIGVEIACTYRNKEHHITTYAFDAQNQALLRLLEANRQVRYEYNNATIKLLEKIRPEVEFAKYEVYQHDSGRGGWKSLNFLLDEGIVANISEFFHLLKELDLSLVFHDPCHVITTIKEAHGFAFLAHPSAYCHGERMPDGELKKWIDFGISGIECYSSYCSVQDAEEYAKFCRKNNLLISGGSDCHGTFILSRKLGHPKITPDMLNLGFM